MRALHCLTTTTALLAHSCNFLHTVQTPTSSHTPTGPCINSPYISHINPFSHTCNLHRTCLRSVPAQYRLTPSLHSHARSHAKDEGYAEDQTNSHVRLNRHHLAEIYFGFNPLPERLHKILQRLPTTLSSILLHRSDIGLYDIAALTAATGDEFALFTRQEHRLLFRGGPTGVPLSLEKLDELKKRGFRFSLHSHPGTNGLSLQASGSPGDRSVLAHFNQTGSLIINSVGTASWFTLRSERPVPIEHFILTWQNRSATLPH